MSTSFAPVTAHTIDPMQEATARAARNAGMSVPDWIEYTNKLEKGAKHLRIIDRSMREVPQYRPEWGGVAA